MSAVEFHAQLLDGCRRLARKGFLTGAADSFSLRIPGRDEMILASGQTDWQQVQLSDITAVPLSAEEGDAGLHATIYKERPDVGAVTVSSPQPARMLAKSGGRLPPLFDEQLRHLGPSVDALKREQSRSRSLVKTLERGGNAMVLDEQLLCLGMTCERVLCNTELYEKCAHAYVIARASGSPLSTIPFWVRLIAIHRLMRNERQASVSYRNGRVPEGIGGY